MTSPMNRRAALGIMARSTVRVSALTVLPAAAAATAPKGDDAEIIALGAEVLRRCEVADDLNERIGPLDGQHWVQEGLRENLTVDECWARAKAWSVGTGREDAIRELRIFDEATDRVYSQMMAIPATTQPGRAAKVRALLVHVMGREWRGPDRELDWEVSKARALLGEFAGMTEEELDNV